jgi:hypothetical protein
MRRLWRFLFGPRPPYTPDHCRTCDRRLRFGQVWEERIHFDPTPELDNGIGGTYAAICYCRRHRPPGAVRA